MLCSSLIFLTTFDFGFFLSWKLRNLIFLNFQNHRTSGSGFLNIFSSKRTCGSRVFEIFQRIDSLGFRVLWPNTLGTINFNGLGGRIMAWTIHSSMIKWWIVFHCSSDCIIMKHWSKSRNLGRMKHTRLSLMAEDNIMPKTWIYD